MTSYGVTRLPFRLPATTRVAWVSDHARAVWKPRVDAIRIALESLAMHAAEVPECCAAFLADTRRDGWLDPTWPMAVRSQPDAGLVVDVRQAASLNTLLRPIGVCPISYHPCSFTCRETAARATDVLRAGRSSGFEQQMDWVDEMLSWPALWSALHGLAEVKIPILRLVTATDATGERIEIRYRSDRFPAEGAVAMTFPYGRPAQACQPRGVGVTTAASPRAARVVRILPVAQ